MRTLHTNTTQHFILVIFLPSIAVYLNRLAWPVTVTTVMTETLGRVYTPLTIEHSTAGAHTPVFALGIEAWEMKVVTRLGTLRTTANPPLISGAN